MSRGHGVVVFSPDSQGAAPPGTAPAYSVPPPAPATATTSPEGMVLLLMALFPRVLGREGRFTIQLLAALDSAHEHNVIHDSAHGAHSQLVIMVLNERRECR